ncbi:hypothetical protein ACGFOM_18130 [Streptomyces sp. NPDC048594]
MGEVEPEREMPLPDDWVRFWTRLAELFEETPAGGVGGPEVSA